jgi:hypothetical protein
MDPDGSIEPSGFVVCLWLPPWVAAAAHTILTLAPLPDAGTEVSIE